MPEIFEYVWYILEHYGLLTLVMITILEVLMALLKTPLKLLTNKIPNERIRKLANKSLIIFVFALSAGIYALGHMWFKDLVPFEPAQVIMTGAFTIVFYSLVDGIIPDWTTFKKVEESAQDLSQKVDVAVKDVKEKNDSSKESAKSAVDSFYDLIKTTSKEVKKSKKN